MSEKVFLTLLDISAVHARRSQEIFSELNLTHAQPKILYILRDSEGFLQKDLATFAKITPPSLTVLLNGMMKNNLVRREKVSVSGGKRAYRVLLTAKGREIADQVYEKIEQLEQECLKGFSDAERNMFFHLMGRMKQNLS